MDKASEAILALKPVTFRYKKEIEPNSAIMIGLIAEEVEQVGDKGKKIYAHVRPWPRPEQGAVAFRAVVAAGQQPWSSLANDLTLTAETSSCA